MIFLPNKFELYTCILRNTMEVLILKNGIKPKYLNNLMKIHTAESLFTDYEEPTHIGNFTLEILKAVKIKKLEKHQEFEFKVSKTDVFLINKKLFTTLLLILSKNSSKLAVKQYRGKVLIITNHKEKSEILKLLKKLNGKYFFEVKTKLFYILLNLPKTSKKPKEEEKDWEYILNPLSVVNIYLEN